MGPEILAISKDIVAVPFEGAVLMCVSLSDSSMVWRKSGNIIDSSQYLNEKVTHDNVSYTLSFLKFCPVYESDEGNYTCSVGDNNSNNTMEANASLQLKGKLYIDYSSFSHLCSSNI